MKVSKEKGIMSELKQVLAQLKRKEITPNEAMNIIKKIDTFQSREKTGNYYFEKCYVQKPCPQLDGRKFFGNVMIVCNEEEFAANFKKELVYRTDIFTDLIWVKRESGDYQLEVKNKIDTIIYVQPSCNSDNLQDKVKESLYSFLRFLKSAAPFCKNSYLEYVCYEEKEDEPVLGAVIGFIRSLAREYDLRGYKSIKIAKREEQSDLSSIIITEYENEDSDVIYEGTKRFCYEMKRYLLQEKEEKLKSGVYVITGGCGGLGRILADSIVDTGSYKLILAGRREENSEIESLCRELSRNKSEVIYHKADICSENDVKQLYDSVLERFGEITGVIHSAGVIRDKLFRNKTREDFDAVLSVKVYGTQYLYKHLPSDAKLYLFSSITSVTGNIGQTDYGYANEFMNKFALEKDKLEGKTRIQSICWPLWKDGGMQIDKQSEKNIEKNVGSKVISNQDGIEAFQVAACSNRSNVIVMNGRYENLVKHLRQVNAVRQIAEKSNDTANTTVTKEQIKRELSKFLIDVIAKETEMDVDEIDVKDDFETLGLNSIMNMNILNAMEEKVGILSKTLLYEAHTIEELAAYILEEYREECLLAFGSFQKRDYEEVQEEQSDSKGEEQVECYEEDDRIAIIGMAGTYPHSNSLEEFWSNIVAGNDCVDEIPASRWDFKKYYAKESNVEGKSNSKWGGFLQDFDKFDPLFFNIPPRDAADIDPQERLMLQTAWHTFENAGYTKEDLNGSMTGVYVGVMYSHYQYYGVGGENHQHGVAMTNSSVSNRISYFMNFHGPSMSIDTMCSSSLTALDIACNDIKLGKIDSALVGGVNLSVHPNKYVILSQKHLLSSDGRCHSFEEGGNGYVPSEGAGAIYIKKLSQAKQDGDQILAVIRATALNHGGHTSGFTVPNPESQGEVIKNALKESKIHTEDITYIEAHGTGTAIGDPIEIKGLSRVFGDDEKKHCAIGSLKSVFGHPESAAGIAAITKVILQMQKKIIPPSIVRGKVNDNLELDKTPFYLVNHPLKWESNGPRIAGISAFGAGGSNAHVILEEYSENTELNLSNEEKIQIFVLSAKDSKQLHKKAYELARFLESKLDKEEVLHGIYDEEQVYQQLKQKLCELLKIEDIEKESSFDELGIDIYTAMLLTQHIAERYGVQYASEEVFDKAAIEELSKDICVRSSQKDIQTSYTQEFFVKAAISLALEREHMTERIAFYTDNLPKVIHILDSYYGDKAVTDGTFYTGNVIKQRKQLRAMPDPVSMHEFIQNRDYKEICRLWVMGVPVDFREFHSKKAHIQLPLYPFKKDPYFTEDMAEKNGEATDSYVPAARTQQQNPMTRKFSTADYFIDGHVVGGRNYLQGVACLELFQKCIQASTGKKKRISNVIWKKPLDLTNGAVDVTVEIKDNKERQNIDVYSGPVNEKILYCSATVSETESSLISLDRREVESSVSSMMQSASFYQVFEKRGIQYSSHLKGIQNLHYSDDYVMASIRFEDEYSSQDNAVRVLDAAVQCGIMLIYGMDNGTDKYVPFSVDQIQFNNSIPKHAAIYIKRVGTKEDMLKNKLIMFDALLTDRNGQKLVEMKRFVCRPIAAPAELPKIQSESSEHVEELMYTKEYVTSDLDISRTNTWSHIIIFVSQYFIQKTKEIVSQWNKNVVVAVPGEHYQKLEKNVYVLNPRRKEELSQLIEDAGIQDDFCIYYLWDIISDEESFENVEVLFLLNQALVKLKYVKHAGFIYTHKYRNVLNDAYGMAIEGLQKTIEREKRGFQYKYVCFNGNDEYSDLLSILNLESAVMEEKNVVYMKKNRQIAVSRKVSADGAEHTKATLDGTWIITGGLGGLGKIFAQYLSNTYNVNLVLTGSSPFNEEKGRFIESIRNHNEIEYVACNVTDYQEVHELVQHVKNKYHTITGVIQAAGIIKDSYIKTKTLESFSQVADVKVKGVQNLYRALVKEELKYFIAFSSVAGVVGNAGQSDYAFANAFVDNFVSFMSSYMKDCKCISINWPYWKNGGMQVSESIVNGMFELYGIRPLETDSGIRLFEEILTLNEKQVAVFYGIQSKIEQQLHVQKSKKNEKRVECVLKESAVTSCHGGVKEIVMDLISDILKINKDDLEEEENFENYGVDSVLSVMITEKLDEVFLDVPKTILFECVNIQELCDYLEENSKMVRNDNLYQEQEENVQRVRSDVEYSVHNQLEDPILDSDIAIVGVSGQYPMAADTEEFWNNLKEGRDCISVIPSDRWDCDAFYTKEKGVDGRTCSKWGGFIQDIDKFDHEFFKITPGEAALMDPQERLFLQETYHAIEDAGYCMKSLKNRNVGVYVGAGYSKYDLLSFEESVREKLVLTNSMNANIANRVSYYFDFHGPSLSIDTMCSSSITAVHMGCKALQYHEADCSIVGGVNLLLHPYKYLVLSLKEFLSTDGRCRGFGAGGDGYVPGEGVGVLVLKRLKDAIRDRDHIYCTIKGSLLNHGGNSRGYSVPNPKAQAKLIADSLRNANISPDEIDYIEMHGTGTELGDPIEIDGVKKAFGDVRPLCGRTPFGTVKSNIGHLEAMSGIAGITKVILQLKHDCLVPSIHTEQINKNLNLEQTKLKIQQKYEPWNHTYNETGKLPHISTVSAFGAGGSNGHVIMKEYIEQNEETYQEFGEIDQLFVFSDLTLDRLYTKAEKFIEYLEKNTFDLAALRNMSYTLKVGKDAMKERVIVIADSSEQLREGLLSFKRQAVSSRVIRMSGFCESRLVQLAGDWCSGKEVEWEKECNANTYKRVSLPLYSFKKQRCWTDVGRAGETLKGLKDPNCENVSSTVISDRNTEESVKNAVNEYLRKLFIRFSIISEDQSLEDRTFEEIGVDSVMIRKLSTEMEKDIEDLSPTIFFECNTMDLLIDYIIENHREFVEKHLISRKTEHQKVDKKIQPAQVQKTVTQDDDIAIIGISGKYPGANTVEELWENLAAGKSEFREIPIERWDYRERFDQDLLHLMSGKSYSKWGAFLDGAYEFDAKFFSIAPLEAELMDPQERLFLECAWHTLEDSGYADEVYKNRKQSTGGKKIGVFVGETTNTYSMHGEVEWSNKVKSFSKSFPWSIANRVSYQFNLTGPSMALDTACSSSLTAIHLACTSIKNGECSMAIAGGVNLYLHQGKFIHLCQSRMLSPTGKCRPFGNGADGFVCGEGVGSVMLKRKADAIADGDRIYAVIRGTAINHGGHTTGYTVPNPVMQSMVIQDAFNKSGVSPSEISHIEAHGTGTQLGDPIEIKALIEAFRTRTDKENYCAISSIKGNIGHAEAAAGISGLTKILMEMRHNALAPNLHYGELNPKIQLEHTPFYVQDHLAEWKENMCAAISSFGAGGANCNVIIEKYPEEQSQYIREEEVYVMPISAQTEESLACYLETLLEWVNRHKFEQNLLHNISFTLQKRANMSCRTAFIASSITEFRSMLEHTIRNQRSSNYGVIGDYVKLANDDVKQLQEWVDGERRELQVCRLAQGLLLSLPLYVFQEKTFRFVTKVESTSTYSNTKLLPLPISCEDYSFKEHKLNGKSILPAACYLECIRMALGSQCLVEDIVFGNAITENNIQMGIYLEHKKEEKYRIISGTSDKQVLHASGKYRMTQKDAAIQLFDSREFRMQCSQPVRVEELYHHLSQVGLEYGEDMKCIKECFRGKDSIYAVLNQAGKTAAETDLFIEPSMLDSAFQLSALLIGKEELKHQIEILPYSVESYEVLQQIRQDATVYVKRRAQNTAEFISYDITIVNEDGTEAVCITNYTVKMKMQHQAAKPLTVKAEEKSLRSSSDLRKSVVRYVIKQVAQVLGYKENEIKTNEYLEVYGIESVAILNITDRFEKDFGDISKTLFFEYKTVNEIADYFMENHEQKCKELFQNSQESQLDTNQEVQYAREEQEIQTGVSTVLKTGQQEQADDEIAIIGMSGVFPGAENLEMFWDNLYHGVDSITEIPKERWDGDEFYESNKNKKEAIYAKWGGFLQDIDKFDPLFFHISPRDAEVMDPQERIFLQCAWKAVEDAGYTRNTLPGKKTSVYVGVMYSQYQLYGAERSMKGKPMALSSSFSSIANRVSYVLNLGGPSLAVDTMCSSSLTALHLACTSILNGESEMSIVGGVNLSLHKNKYTLLCHGKFLSSDGKCRSFGEGGDGYVPGEGVGAIILKPRRKAEQDGDNILAIVRGTAINHGGKTNGYSVPNPQAQIRVLDDAIKASGIKPAELSYLEAHGTGTALGDPIEMLSMNSTYGKEFKQGQTCYLGSVKSNIGHLESAAGIAAIIKVILQFQNKLIVPSLHSSVINKKIDIEKTPFRIPQRIERWEQKERLDGTKIPRMASINSFGAGGSNAHVILQEYEQQHHWNTEEKNRVYTLSAFNEERLQESAMQLLDYLKKNREVPMESLAYMLQAGREQMEARVAFIAVNQEELIQCIHNYLGKREDRHVRIGHMSQYSGEEESMDNLRWYSDEELAEHWISGEQINWRELYEGRTIPKISIPTYPFAKERYWVPAGSNETVDESGVKSSITTITRNVPYVRDHMVLGICTVPGAALLDIMRREAGIVQVPFAIDNVLFQSLVQVEETDRKLTVNIAKQREHYYDAVLLEENQGIVAKASFHVNDVREASIHTIRKYMPSDGVYVRKESCYEFFQSMGLEYKESMQGLKEVQIKDGAVYAILEEPDFSNDNHKGAEVSFFDSILQAVTLRAYHETNVAKYVPYSMEHVVVQSIPKGNVLVYIEQCNTVVDTQKKFNIFAWNETGELCITIENYVVHQIIETISDSEMELETLLMKLKNDGITIDQADEFLEDIL